MSRLGNARIQKDGDEDLADMPPHEEVHSDAEGGGVTVNLDELPGAKKKGDERSTKKGGEERADDELADNESGLEAADPSEERRTARRQERKARKEERVRREREIEAERDMLRERVASLEEGRAQDRVQDVRERVGRIESEMGTLQRQYDEAKKLKQTAYDNKDGASAVAADEAMAAARERYNELNSERARIVAAVQQSERQPRVSETLKQNAQAFMDEHDWYDIKGGDRDSARVLAIDRKMANEGWDPNTKGYWDELRERVREELPHRFEDNERQDDDRPPTRQRTGGSERDTPRGGGNTFHLSAARVAALKEAGMWDDPAKRAKMIRTYKARDDAEARAKAQRR